MEISDEFLTQHLSNWSIVVRYDSGDEIKHMGMLMLKSKFGKQDITIENGKQKKYMKNKSTQIQILFSTFKEYNIRVGFIYARQTPTQEEIKQMKKDYLECHLLMGDLNLDSNREADSQKLKSLLVERSNVLNEVTTTRFNQIDHIHLNLKEFNIYFATSFINYTTDHHLLSIRIPKHGNKFSTRFLEKMSFNIEKETRSKPMDPRRRFQRNKQTEEKGKIISVNRAEIDLTFDNGASSSIESEKQSKIDLTCLFSPNWLNDEVINKYLQMLNKHNSNIFIYDTTFHTAFVEGGFERVQNYYRRKNVLSFNSIFIPVHLGSHWFLITYNGEELISFDPYNYPDSVGRKKQDLLEINKKFHTDILTKLKCNYLQPLFQKYNKQWIDISIKVKLPPEIPAQDNGHDCGVFLLMFAKCIILHLDFDFATDDMINIRDKIKEEINADQINRNIPHGRLRKRKGKRNETPTKKMRHKIEMQCPQRTIINPDAETCWLNSCLQVVLAAMDFKETLCPIGSVFWQNLICLQEKGASVALDPTDIKQTIILTERARILRKNVLPTHTLFDIGNLPLLYNEGLRTQRIGQQDCRDFFFCINENREAWPDVFNLFKVKTLSETECCRCGYVSRQEINANEMTVITLTCPLTEVNMKNFLEYQLNGSHEVENWRDEDGCGNIVNGMSRTRISDIDES